MKLLHKFLIALLLISIIPLILYSFILLTSTAVTLRNVINQNILYTVNSASMQVNKFIVELEKKLDIARQIERSGNMPVSKKGELFFNEMSSSKILLAIFLLDRQYLPLTGFTSKNIPDTILFDKEILQKVTVTGKVQVTTIRYMENDKPYFDIAYPLSLKPAQYVYYRVRLDYLGEMLKPFITTNNNSSKTFFIIDDFGSSISVPQGLINNFSVLQQKKYLGLGSGTMFIEEGKINVVTAAGPLNWILLYRETTIEAYSEITRIKVVAFSMIFFTFCLSIFGAISLAKNLTKPIRTLVLGMELVASGNLDHQVPVVSKDEISKLANFFNEMLAKLKKLQEDIKKAERLSTIGQMANILGHEIRNPLGAITNAAYLIKIELLKLTTRDNKIFKRLDIIENEIRSTNKIINDMLDFSRTRPPVLTNKNFNETIKNILEETVIPENVELITEFNEIPQIPIDIEEIKQVIRNLINNSIDSMSEVPLKKLTLKTTKAQITYKETQIPAVKLQISDTGCGIPKEIQGKIFEPFFSTKSKGTGLGLAVVHKIIKERHKGLLELESEKGKGTSFYIYLPVEHPTT